MDLRTLNYVTAIAKYQNLTKAAESLYVGQPTLSKFLASLEEELGIKLFRKVGNRYLLTYAGERYVEKAKQILLLNDDLNAEMADILKQDVGVLNIAFAYMRCTYMLPLTLPVFHEKYPHVKVNLFEGRSGDNDQKVIDGRIDAAFYTRPSEPNPLLDYHSLSSEELLICTPKNHQVRQYARENPDGPYPLLNLEYLVDEMAILMQPEQRTRQIVDGLLRETHIQFSQTFLTTSIQAIMGLVASGFGISFVFEPHLKYRIDSLPLDCYSIGNRRVFSDFVAATRKGSYLSRYTHDYIDIVRQASRELQLRNF